ncbi:hypothetical protein ATN79_48250 [Paraburkholderia caribensis]|nr:hypothetical protein ATN79_48250 [Paraburkholderia caribensis]
MQVTAQIQGSPLESHGFVTKIIDAAYSTFYRQFYQSLGSLTLTVKHASQIPLALSLSIFAIA